MTKTFTKEQVNKKYKGKYVKFYKNFDGTYDIHKVYHEIHEDTSLGEDVGTPLEYTR